MVVGTTASGPTEPGRFVYNQIHAYKCLTVIGGDEKDVLRPGRRLRAVGLTPDSWVPSPEFAASAARLGPGTWINAGAQWSPGARETTARKSRALVRQTRALHVMIYDEYTNTAKLTHFS